MAGVEDKRSVASELAAERFRLATELAVAGRVLIRTGLLLWRRTCRIWVRSSLATHVSADR